MKNQKMLALATTAALSASLYISSDTAFATHEVESGESLWSISREYKMSVDELRGMNNLDSTIIYPEQELKVVEEGTKYKIQKNDTLSEIAKEYNVTVEQLKDWNGLTSDLIYKGDTLAIAASAAYNKSDKQEVSKAPVTAPVSQKNNEQKSEQVQSTQSQNNGEVGKTLTMDATAYTAYCDGCSGITANGTDLRANPNIKVIAVDPSIIPLGTKVWVDGYGEAIAADTGGAIKGNKIDLFMPSKDDALKWGRKTVTVKIMK